MSDSKLNGNILIERYASVRTECHKLLKIITTATDNVYKSQVLNGDDNSSSHLTMKDSMLLQAAGFRRQALEELSNALPILDQDTLNASQVQEAAKLIDNAKQNVLDAYAKLKEAQKVSDSEPAAQPEENEPEAPEASSDARPQYGTPKPAPQTQAQPVQEPAPATPEQPPTPADANTALSPEMKEFIAQAVKDEVNVAYEATYHHLHDELTKEFQKSGNFPPEWTSVATKYSAEDFERLLKLARKYGGVAKFFDDRKYNFRGKHSNNAAPQQETHIPEAAPEQRVSHN